MDKTPSQKHAKLLHDIADFCNETKEALGPAITHLKALQVDELESQVNATVAEVVQNLNAEVDRAQTINAEAEAKEAERQKEISDLKLEVQNQLAKKPISQYKQIFAEQAKKHQKMAWVWLGGNSRVNHCLRIHFQGAIAGPRTCRK